MSDEVILTKEGKEELEKRLKYLKVEKSAEVTERIKVAREFGDLSENAEYRSARRAFGRNESRIRFLQKMIRTAKVVST